MVPPATWILSTLILGTIFLHEEVETAQIFNIRAIVSGVSGFVPVKIQVRTRRLFVVRCCGRRSCMPRVLKSKNDTKVVYEYEYEDEDNATTIAGGAGGGATTIAGGDTAAGGETTAAGGDTTAAADGDTTAAAGGDTTAAGGDTAAAGGDTTAAGGDTAAAGGDTTLAEGAADGDTPAAEEGDTTVAGGESAAPLRRVGNPRNQNALRRFSGRSAGRQKLGHNKRVKVIKLKRTSSPAPVASVDARFLKLVKSAKRTTTEEPVEEPKVVVLSVGLATQKAKPHPHVQPLPMVKLNTKTTPRAANIIRTRTTTSVKTTPPSTTIKIAEITNKPTTTPETPSTTFASSPTTSTTTVQSSVATSSTPQLINSPTALSSTAGSTELTTWPLVNAWSTASLQNSAESTATTSTSAPSTSAPTTGPPENYKPDGYVASFQEAMKYTPEPLFNPFFH